jgi:hypothetical protein
MKPGLIRADIFALKFLIMKKILALGICCLWIISACINTVSTTTIKDDGSGSMIATVDLSEMLKMMAGKKKEGEDISLDTTIHFHHFSDTASFLTVRQKELLKEMTLNIVMDSRNVEDLKFNVSIRSVFKTLDDFNALNELMKQKEYDAIFDRAMDLPMFAGPQGGPGEKKENDNIFASIFPSFFTCTYSKTSINCKVDRERYKLDVEELEKSGIDFKGDLEAKMFGSASFSNKIILPRKATIAKGTSWKQGQASNELVQTGNILDLYKYPENYEYQIQY